MLQPTCDRVLIKPAEKITESKGGILLPDKAKDAPAMGVIVATGPQVKGCREGHTVLYGKYAGVIIEDEGTKYLVMREDDVLAVKQ